jgi:predicted lipoprotein with Yx(FWY)xxD motif
MHKRIICLVALVGCWAVQGRSAQAAPLRTVPMSTPAGVTVIDVFGFDGRFLWRYLATDHGKPLYVLDTGGNSGQACAGDCAKEFVPYLAKDEVTPSGDWSTTMLNPNERQWTYKHHPLYYFNGKDPVPINTNPVDSYNTTDSPFKFDKRILDPGSDFFSPQKGWRRAAFAPDETSVPSGIKLGSLGVANGYALAEANTGMPLYVLATPAKNPQAWTPMHAPDLAGPVGDFGIVVTRTGRKQWSYQGAPLYTYNGDYSSDDLNGLLEQKDAQVALVYKNFMPSSVRIKFVPARGPIMMTLQGKTLYTQALGGGARESERRGDLGPSYGAGKALGTKGCVDECLRTWQPLLATDQDEASGFWEILARDDGSKQWAYKGSALYTYVGDNREGDVDGNGQRVIVYGDKYGKNYDDVTLAGGNRGPLVRLFAGSGFHWNKVGLSD